MKRLISPLVVALIALAALLPVGAGAAAPALKPQAEVLGPIVSNGDTATLTVKYRCNAGDTVWVSAKQSSTGKPDQRLREEGSSQYAGAMLHSHRNPITCDGKQHVQTFTIDKVEWGFGQLKKGVAWVQFCVTDTATESLTLSKATWAAVK